MALNKNKIHGSLFTLLFVISVTYACTKEEPSKPDPIIILPNPTDEDTTSVPVDTTTNNNPMVYKEISFANWKVTLPVDLDNNGSPDEYQPNQLINYGYRNIPALKNFMYDDFSDSSIVFYTYPAGATTTNSSYPRTELRELLTPGNNYANWAMNQGGTCEGTLKVDSISLDNSSSEYTNSRTIVMQIHGVVSQADVAKYGLSSNSAPPLLKMTWIDGEMIAYKKNLKDESTGGADLYTSDSDTWGDIKHNFGYVGYDKFTVKIVASTGKLVVTVNESIHIFEDVSLAKWPFDNYFKAGNYLSSTDPTSYAKIKYYTLEVNHP